MNRPDPPEMPTPTLPAVRCDVCGGDIEHGTSRWLKLSDGQSWTWHTEHGDDPIEMRTR